MQARTATGCGCGVAMRMPLPALKTTCASFCHLYFLGFGASAPLQEPSVSPPRRVTTACQHHRCLQGGFGVALRLKHALRHQGTPHESSGSVQHGRFFQREIPPNNVLERAARIEAALCTSGVSRLTEVGRLHEALGRTEAAAFTAVYAAAFVACSLEGQQLSSQEGLRRPRLKGFCSPD
jgi:hypothetical protein